MGVDEGDLQAKYRCRRDIILENCPIPIVIALRI